METNAMTLLTARTNDRESDKESAAANRPEHDLGVDDR